MKKKILMMGMVLLISIISFNGYAASGTSTPDTVKYHLRDVVVTANRYEKNVFETNIPVNIVGETRVWQNGINSIGELVEKEAGVNFSNVGPWSQKVSIRGLVGPHVLTLVDGMRLNGLRSYGNHALLIDVNQVERVEIIRGPSSILYGSEAVAGVVNYITKKPPVLDYNFYLLGNLNLTYSSVNQQHSEQFTLTGGLKKWSFLLGINNRKAEDINTPKGILKNTAFNGYTIDTKLGFNPSKKHHFLMTSQFNRSKNVGVPINKYAAHANFLKYNRDLVTFSYDYVNPESKWNNAKLNFYYQQGYRNFDALIYQKPKGPLFVNQTLNANRDTRSFGGSFQNSFSLFNKNLLILGLDVFANTDDTERIADPEITNAAGAIVKNPPADLTPPTPKSNRTGAAIFLEDEYAVNEKWNINFGARFDYIVSNTQGTKNTLTETDIKKEDKDFSGNFGLLYRFSEHVHFIANAGRAFKAPTLQERFFKGTAQVGYLYGNPDLKSETSFNLDVGMKLKSSRISGEVNIFRNQIENFIVMNPISVQADTFLYDNVGKAEIYGGEFQINFNITKQLSFFMNNAYVHGENINLGEPLPKMPPLTSLIGFRYEAQKSAYWLEINSKIVDTQKRIVENEKETGGYTLFNLSSGVNLQKIVALPYPVFLTLNVHNFLDRSYRDHLSSVTWWDAPGRNFVIGLRSNF